MSSIADRLPPEIAGQMHPDRRKNETGYWAMRASLLAQYEGQWIGFADGEVIAAGKSPVAVFHAAEASGLLPFLICVGKEDRPARRRRAAFAIFQRKRLGRSTATDERALRSNLHV